MIIISLYYYHSVLMQKYGVVCSMQVCVVCSMQCKNICIPFKTMIKTYINE